MTITGERFLPELDADWTLEHTHRYLLAREFAAGKAVLDIACGEGYGSRMLADTAKSVVGVDISFATVAAAAVKYRHPRLSFLRGSAAAIPLADNAVDLVTSFETLEHLAEQEAMIREIRRVLRPGGLLLISSPDKREYSDLTGYANEYHVKELYRDEFEALLRKEFSRLRLLGQRVVFGSVMGAEDASAFFSWNKNDREPHVSGLSNAEYLIALAGDGEVPPLPSGILKAPQSESDMVRDLAGQLAAAKADIAWYKNWETGARADLNRLEGRVLHLEEQTARLTAELAGVYASKSWRVTAPLRFLMSLARRARRAEQPVPAPVACDTLPVWDARATAGAVWPPDVRALQKPLRFDHARSSAAPRLGVFLHAFYSELAGEMLACLRNIPETSDIFISTDTEEKRADLEALFAANGFGTRTEIRVFPNAGWDIAPFLVGFADAIPRYDLLLRLHSKRSTFIPGNVGDAWRAMLYASLAGSAERVNAVLGAFAADGALGLVCPPNLAHYADSITIGKNFATMRDLLAPHGVTLEPDTPVDFPMGSMFWCRPAVLAPWLEKGFSFEDFAPTDTGIRDGTLAHALERLFFFGCGITGHTWARASVSDRQ